MNREIQPVQDDVDDRDIRDLMREADYPGRMSDAFKRSLARDLNRNFAYRRLRTQMVAAAAVVVAVVSMITLFHATDVGSDAFELEPQGWTSGGRPVVESPITGWRINVPSRNDPASKGRMSAEEIYEREQAGLTKLVSVESWTVDGESFVHEIRDVLGDDGKAALQMAHPVEGSVPLALKLLKWKKSDGKAVMDSINAGLKLPDGTDTVEYRGGPLTMSRWTCPDSTLGTVIYRRYDVPQGD